MTFYKLILIELILLGSFFSQGYSQSNIDVGLGISNSHISMNDASVNSQNMWSPDFNINYYREINNKFLHNVGLHYQSNRFAIQLQNGTTNDYNLSYFRIPVSIGYLAMNKKLKLNLIGGPYVGLLVNAKEKIYLRSTIGGEIISSHQNNIKDNLSNLDFGLQIGVKFSLKNGLSLNGKYWYSLNKIKYNLMNNESLSFITLGLSYNIKNHSTKP